MADLKPCPFCGSNKLALDTDGHLTWVLCIECDARGRRILNGRLGKKKQSKHGIGEQTMDDLISRQQAIDAMQLTDSICEQEAIDALCELPFAQPERKTGRWIESQYETLRTQGYYVCSECGHGYQRFERGQRKSTVSFIDGTQYELHRIDNFCPNCGAKMEVEHG